MDKSNKPLVKHITDFLEYCEVEKGLSQLSVKNYGRFIGIFEHWLVQNNLGNIKPHELSPSHIWKYRVFLSRYVNVDTKKELKKSTQNYYLIALRNLLGYLADKDIISVPVDKVKLSKETKQNRTVKFLSIDQLQKLLSMPDIKTKTGLRDRAIMEALFSTGLRVAELTSLNINQINFKDLYKTDSFELTIVGKGDRPRTIYFSQRALYWLKKFLEKRKDDDKALFINYHPLKSDDHRLTTRSVERMVSKYSKMAGLPVMATPHTLRHTYATDLLNKGVDLRFVQEFLGHKDISTTQVYTHVTNKKLKDIHKKFHSGGDLE
jgi:site-specific recombinase XerD